MIRSDEPSTTRAAWSRPGHARTYARFCREHEYYAEGARALARCAGPVGDQRVAELGCGTGASTRWLSAGLTSGSYLALDPSAAMLEEARAQELPSGIRLCQGDHEDLVALAEELGGFDRVLAASVVWLEPRRRDLFDAVSRSLRPGGRFLFTLAAEAAGETDHLTEPAALRFWTRFASLRDELGLPLPGPGPLAPGRFGLPAWLDDLKAAGFVDSSVCRHSFQQPLASWLAQIALPAVLADYFPGAPPDRTRGFVEELARRIEGDQSARRVWLVIEARRGAAAQ